MDEKLHGWRNQLTWINLPFKGVLALCSEKVYVRLELKFEDVLLVNAVRFLGRADRVAEQWKASQREVVLQTRHRQTPQWRAFTWARSLSQIYEGWPDVSYRRTSRSWWKRPRVSANRYCSWTSSGGNPRAGSTEERGERNKVRHWWLLKLNGFNAGV